MNGDQAGGRYGTRACVTVWHWLVVALVVLALLSPMVLLVVFRPGAR